MLVSILLVLSLSIVDGEDRVIQLHHDDSNFVRFDFKDTRTTKLIYKGKCGTGGLPLFGETPPIVNWYFYLEDTQNMAEEKREDIERQKKYFNENYPKMEKLVYPVNHTKNNTDQMQTPYKQPQYQYYKGEKETILMRASLQKSGFKNILLAQKNSLEDCRKNYVDNGLKCEFVYLPHYFDEIKEELEAENKKKIVSGIRRFRDNKAPDHIWLMFDNLEARCVELNETTRRAAAVDMCSSLSRTFPATPWKVEDTAKEFQTLIDYKIPSMSYEDITAKLEEKCNCRVTVYGMRQLSAVNAERRYVFHTITNTTDPTDYDITMLSAISVNMECWDEQNQIFSTDRTYCDRTPWPTRRYNISNSDFQPALKKKKLVSEYSRYNHSIHAVFSVWSVKDGDFKNACRDDKEPCGFVLCCNKTDEECYDDLFPTTTTSTQTTTTKVTTTTETFTTESPPQTWECARNDSNSRQSMMVPVSSSIGDNTKETEDDQKPFMRCYTGLPAEAKWTLVTQNGSDVCQNYCMGTVHRAEEIGLIWWPALLFAIIMVLLALLMAAIIVWIRGRRQSGVYGVAKTEEKMEKKGYAPLPDVSTKSVDPDLVPIPDSTAGPLDIPEVYIASSARAVQHSELEFYSAQPVGEPQIAEEMIAPLRSQPRSSAPPKRAPPPIPQLDIPLMDESQKKRQSVLHATQYGLGGGIRRDSEYRKSFQSKSSLPTPSYEEEFE